MAALPGNPGGMSMRDATPETRLRGVSLCPGVALGRACFYGHLLPCPNSGELQSESERLEAALAWMSERKVALALCSHRRPIHVV